VIYRERQRAGGRGQKGIKKGKALVAIGFQTLLGRCRIFNLWSYGAITDGLVALIYGNAKNFQ
jgi:hypothetical protein